MKVKKAAAGVGMGMGMGPGAGRERRLKQGPKQGCGMGILRRRRFKAKEGTPFGMLSVEAGIDKNPNPTQADRIAGAKKSAGKKAKGGVALKKQAATAITMKKAGKSPKKAMNGMKKMMGGGKCKYGC